MAAAEPAVVVHEAKQGKHEEHYTTSRRSQIKYVPVSSSFTPFALTLPAFSPTDSRRSRSLATAGFKPLQSLDGLQPSPSPSASSVSSGASSPPRSALEARSALPRTAVRREEGVGRRGADWSTSQRSSIPVFWPLIIPYIVWVFCIDKAPVNGGRASQWVRKSRFWVWFASYYPVRYAQLLGDVGVAWS